MNVYGLLTGGLNLSRPMNAVFGGNGSPATVVTGSTGIVSYTRSFSIPVGALRNNNQENADNRTFRDRPPPDGAVGGPGNGFVYLWRLSTVRLIIERDIQINGFIPGFDLFIYNEPATGIFYKDASDIDTPYFEPEFDFADDADWNAPAKLDRLWRVDPTRDGNCYGIANLQLYWWCGIAQLPGGTLTLTRTRTAVPIDQIVTP